MSTSNAQTTAQPATQQQAIRIERDFEMRVMALALTAAEANLSPESIARALRTVADVLTKQY